MRPTLANSARGTRLILPQCLAILKHTGALGACVTWIAAGAFCSARLVVDLIERLQRAYMV
jgi:hypothetical protein